MGNKTNITLNSNFTYLGSLICPNVADPTLYMTN